MSGTGSETTSPDRADERLDQRHGDNLYPVRFEQTFGDEHMTLDVPRGVWNPTPHGVHLGNILTGMDFTGEHVLELGTGCGIHAILLARRGAARMTLTEIFPEINANAKHNLEKNGVDVPVEYLVADWTQVPGASHEGGPFDCMVTNPPFGKAGKRYRRYFIDTLILDAHKLVRPGGRLVFIHSSMADVPRTLRMLDEHGMQVRILGETSGPFREYYYEDDAFIRDALCVPGGSIMIDGVHHERLTAFEARLPG